MTQLQSSTPGMPTATALGPEAWEVKSPAQSAYALHAVIGGGGLAGYFRKNGKIVFTPRMDEAGYIHPANEDDDNGPMQIQQASAESVQAHIQFTYRCYKKITDPKTGEAKKDDKGQDQTTPAIFPLEATKLVVNNPIPHEVGGPRPLVGITHTPLVRKDGTLITEPGYDAATRYLYAPEVGLEIPAVPSTPTADEVAVAVALLDEMVAGFEWRGKHDKANLFGLLLTPMLRLIAPPAYKMFAVDAHQPGSGKTLLASTARWIHGGVFRTEMPTEEPELKKLITSVLYTTSAPVVLVDNVSGSLKSSTLAGLLTSREYSDRILGRTENVSMDNDRVWLITGNNVAIGGDLGRRTITIAIDPGVPNPETRTGFAISDLEAWVKENRGRLLHALLTLVTSWAAAGRPLQAREQSDSYARWEAIVGGILANAGVPGSFDHLESRNVRGDDEEKAWRDFLLAIRGQFGGEPFHVAELIAKIRQGTPSMPASDEPDFGEMEAPGPGAIVPGALPTSKLEEQARVGRLSSKSIANFLSNRQGRWFGRLAIVQAGERDTHKGQPWRIRSADDPH